MMYLITRWHLQHVVCHSASSFDNEGLTYFFTPWVCACRIISYISSLFDILVKMSAQEQMRAMLDQLMGTARDGKSTRINELIDSRLQPCDHETKRKFRHFYLACVYFPNVFAALRGYKSKQRQTEIAIQIP